ncbi:uncharacterized protein LOC110850356 isoform X2 [Folsomia candida]|uniref:uncharacterized protein LOC110850356 isoform X2 n=1 Tax=Folsomia candida TaxID=158441 RepID=UPI000B8F6703|nr:uncharacterized protein LOC110850356 isoform X2 [Folsomia candida]
MQTMKVIILLGAVVAMAHAAPESLHGGNSQYGKAVSNSISSADQPPTSSAQNAFLNIVSGDSLAWCGGYTAPECSNACYWLGYRCYRCTSSFCECSQSGC